MDVTNIKDALLRVKVLIVAFEHAAKETYLHDLQCIQNTLEAILTELAPEKPVTVVGEKKNYCTGCTNNVYNGQLADQCWNLCTAALVMKKRVPIDQRPPWNQPAELMLSCYHERGYVMVDGDAIR